MVGADGVLRGPAGGGRFAGVAQDDVAEAAAILTDPEGHDGARYDLTGPEAPTFVEAPAVMSRCLGRAIAFQDESREEAYASWAPYAAPRWQLDAWVSTYTAVAAGELATVTDHVERLTGRRPRSLEQVLCRR